MTAGADRPASGGPIADLAAPPSPDAFLRRYAGRGAPVVLRGLVADSPAVETWTPAYLAAFAARMGDLQVPYRTTPDDMPSMDLARIQCGRTSLVGLLKDCERSPRGRELYVPGIDLPPGTPLGADVPAPGLLSKVDIYSTTVFLGRNTRCIGHFHPKTQALLCQVQGAKRITLYPPSDLGRLHLFPVWSRGFFQSRVNFYGDRSGFPRLARARPLVVDLAPGDALFIPLHWLHVPHGDGWSVSVTHWWRPAAADWLSSAGTPRALAGIACELARQRGLRLGGHE